MVGRSGSLDLVVINGVEFIFARDCIFGAFNCCELAIGAADTFVGDGGAELLDGTMVGLVLIC
jgi:hypothetical protein